MQSHATKWNAFLQLLMTLWPWPFTLQTKINSLNFRSSFRSQLFVVSRIRDDPQKARQYPHLSLATKCTFLIQICVVGCRQHRTLVVMFEMFRHLQTDTPQPLARRVIYDMVYSTSKRCWQTKQTTKTKQLPLSLNHRQSSCWTIATLYSIRLSVWRHRSTSCDVFTGSQTDDLPL